MRVWRVALPALALTAFLAGCGAAPASPINGVTKSTPSPTPSSPAPLPTSPRPSASAPSTPTTVGVRLDAGHLTIIGGSGEALSSTDLTASVDDLTALLGPPAVTTTTGQEHCTIAGTTYDWKGALNLFAPTGGGAYETRLLARSITGLAGGTVQLTGPDDVQVGDDITHLIASTPETLKDTYESDGTSAATVLIGPVETPADETQGTRGVAAFTQGGRVTALGWPVSVHSNGDC